jgi:hypothetical protein
MIYWEMLAIWLLSCRGRTVVFNVDSVIFSFYWVWVIDMLWSYVFFCYIIDGYSLCYGSKRIIEGSSTIVGSRF